MQMPAAAPRAPNVGRTNVHLQVALSTFSGGLLESCSWLTGQERGPEMGLFFSDSRSWLTMAFEMPGSLDHSLEKRAMCPALLPGRNPTATLCTALPEGSVRSSLGESPQPAKSPSQTALTTWGHHWSEGPGQRLAAARHSGKEESEQLQEGGVE